MLTDQAVNSVAPVPEEIHLRDYLLVIRKRKWAIITALVIIVTMVAIHTFRQRPVYKATLQLLIERETPNLVDFQKSPTNAVYDDYLQTQCKILRSRYLANRVINELNLDLVADNLPGYSPGKGRVDGLLNLISVEPIRGTRIVSVNVKSYHSGLAAQIANALANIYIAADLENKISAARSAYSWLSQELQAAKDKVENSQKALQEYAAVNQLVILEERQKIESERIGILSKSLTEAKAKRFNLAERYKKQHPSLVQIDTEMVLLENSLNQAIDQQQKISLELEAKRVRQAILKQEVETNRQMYDALLTRLKETDITGSIKVGNIKIVDLAEVPQYPFLPRKQTNMVVSLVAGLCVGIGLAFFIEYLDDTIRTEEDIRQYIKLPVLGHVPTIRIGKGKKVNKFERHTFVLKFPKSMAAESFRSIRTRVLASSYERPIKFLMVTSSSPEEGKSITSCSLAITIAQTGARVLLVEADLRRPVFRKIFNLDHSVSGMSEYLLGQKELKEVQHQTFIPNFYVIPCGQIPNHPAELLVSAKMRSFFDELRNSEEFDHIVIDTPPAINVTDPGILVAACDGVILVARAGKIGRRIVRLGKEKLENLGARIIGLVINDISMDKGGYYYYPYRYYYYGEDKKETKRLIRESELA